MGLSVPDSVHGHLLLLRISISNQAVTRIRELPCCVCWLAPSDLGLVVVLCLLACFIPVRNIWAIQATRKGLETSAENGAIGPLGHSRYDRDSVRLTGGCTTLFGSQRARGAAYTKDRPGSTTTSEVKVA